MVRVLSVIFDVILSIFKIFVKSKGGAFLLDNPGFELLNLPTLYNVGPDKP